MYCRDSCACRVNAPQPGSSMHRNQLNRICEFADLLKCVCNPDIASQSGGQRIESQCGAVRAAWVLGPFLLKLLLQNRENRLYQGHLHRQRIPRFPAPGLSAELWTLRILQAGQQAGYLITQCLPHASSSVGTRSPSSACLRLKLPFLTLAHTTQSSSSGLYLPCFHFGERYFFLQKLLKAGPEQQPLFSVLNVSLRDRQPVHRVRKT
ncbi:protein-L-isoaspartate O-methyltransferase domain-containing protein 1 isoform X7 [Kogia breviceps]|uniref:protein-L-isoaspartate O-methyltransferase domain-containing protein 1 isoform X7 n=1 Tax=Kogia breviceps TaxID=27615 RepID=UPI0034D293F7